MKKTILIADDDKTFLDAMALRCKSLGPRVDTACDGAQVLMQVSQNPPDLLILDINMPSGNGLDVAARLLQDPRIPPVPVVFCTGRSDQETIDRCKELGAHYIVKDGDTWGNLRPVIRRILGIVTHAGEVASIAKAVVSPLPKPEQKPRLPRLLFVDDDADLRRAMQIRLRVCEVEVIAASNAMQALWMAVNKAPDIIVTDYWMPAGSGEYLLSRLRAVPIFEADSGGAADRRDGYAKAGLRHGAALAGRIQRVGPAVQAGEFRRPARGDLALYQGQYRCMEGRVADAAPLTVRRYSSSTRWSPDDQPTLTGSPTAMVRRPAISLLCRVARWPLFKVTTYLMNDPR